MAWCDLGTIDPVMVGEMALRLALLYEATSMQQMNASRHTDTGVWKGSMSQKGSWSPACGRASVVIVSGNM